MTFQPTEKKGDGENENCERSKKEKSIIIKEEEEKGETENV